MKKTFLVLIAFLLITNISIYSQETAEGSCQESSFVDVSVGADIVSRYLWRGMEFGGTPATPQIQPYINFDFNLNSENVFTLGAWGSHGFSGSYDEIDFYAKHAFSPAEFGTLSIIITDFYYPYLNISFYDFSNDGSGAHTVELALAYDGTEKFPVHLLIANNILNDLEGFKSFYSEIGYTVNVKDVSLFFIVGGAAGISPWNMVSEEGFKLTNIGLTASKSVKVTEDYSVPVALSWVLNPHLKKSYITAKISLF